MVKVMCPRCGKLHQKGQRCTCSPSKSNWKRSAEQERARKSRNPWRTQYSSVEYQRARQAVLEATGGRCAVSGVRIADKVHGRWVMRGNGGIHHRVPLSQGGSNDVSNLVPLETGVHNRIDAERRRKCGTRDGSRASSSSR